MRPEPGPLINERLTYKFRDLRIIGPDGAQVGILQSRQALSMAREQGLDLVLVSATAQPPVARIIDYGRHKYETDKLARDKKSKQQEVKGINISPRIAEHDMETQVRKAMKFLGEGSKVRVVCRFKSREITHPEIGRHKMDIFSQAVANEGIVERVPTLDGRQMIMVLTPKPHTGSKKHAENQDKQNGGEAVQDHRHREDHPTEVVQQPHVPAQEGLAEASPGAGA